MNDLNRPRLTQPAQQAAAYGVLAVSLLVTLSICIYIARTTRQSEREQFLTLVDQSRAALNTRLETYIATLRAGAALFSASQRVTRDEFHRFAQSLDLQTYYPGIQGIGYTVRIEPEKLEEFVAAVRQQDRPDFHVWPENPRQEYHAILYLEPMDRRNAAAMGYDMYSEPVRQAAMARARDLGVAAASGRVELVQEVDEIKQAGFLIYVPVYRSGHVPATLVERREGLVGFVYAPFRVGDLLKGVYGEMGEEGVAFRIYDSPERTADGLLHEPIKQPPTRPRQVLIEPFNAAGRQWSIEYFSLPLLENQSPRGLVAVVGAAGLGFSYLLFSLLRSQMQARTSAEQNAAELRIAAADLREARDAAESANRLKDEFLATVSHELRTPLNAIMGWTELLRHSMHSPKEIEHGLSTIDRNARSQAQLIEDLLDVGRIISGKMRLSMSRIDIGEQIDSAIDAVMPSAQAKGVKLVREPDATSSSVLADPARLAQILWNLLTNSIKFTPRGGEVTVRCWSDNDCVTVEIADSGIGISQEFLPHVFDRFRQADSTSTRKYGGLGLGLSIVRYLVESQGGTVQADSPGENLGATFRVKLPVAS